MEHLSPASARSGGPPSPGQFATTSKDLDSKEADPTSTYPNPAENPSEDVAHPPREAEETGKSYQVKQNVPKEGETHFKCKNCYELKHKSAFSKKAVRNSRKHAPPNKKEYQIICRACGGLRSKTRHSYISIVVQNPPDAPRVLPEEAMLFRSETQTMVTKGLLWQMPLHKRHRFKYTTQLEFGGKAQLGDDSKGPWKQYWILRTDMPLDGIRDKGKTRTWVLHDDEEALAKGIWTPVTEKGRNLTHDKDRPMLHAHLGRLSNAATLCVDSINDAFMPKDQTWNLESIFDEHGFTTIWQLLEYCQIPQSCLRFPEFAKLGKHLVDHLSAAVVDLLRVKGYFHLNHTMFWDQIAQLKHPFVLRRGFKGPFLHQPYSGSLTRELIQADRDVLEHAANAANSEDSSNSGQIRKSLRSAPPLNVIIHRYCPPYVNVESRQTQYDLGWVDAKELRLVRAPNLNIFKTNRHLVYLQTWDASNDKFLSPDHTRPFSRLQDDDLLGYKCSGIVPYREKPDGSLEILMGEEIKGSRAADAGKLSFFAGKREVYDKCALTTAMREFQEESAFVLTKDERGKIAQTIRNANDVFIWDRSSKMFLFAWKYDLDFDLIKRFDEQYNPEDVTLEMRSLHWVDVPLLDEWFREKREAISGATFGSFRGLRSVAQIVLRRQERERLWPFAPHPDAGVSKKKLPPALDKKKLVAREVEESLPSSSGLEAQQEVEKWAEQQRHKSPGRKKTQGADQQGIYREYTVQEDYKVKGIAHPRNPVQSPPQPQPAQVPERSPPKGLGTVE